MKKSLLLFMSVLSFALSACGDSQDDYRVKLNKNTLELEVGETETLTVDISPNDITNPHLVWTVDSGVATIDAGVVTALAIGVSEIKVFLDLNSNLFYDEGEPLDVCVLTVNEPHVDFVAVTSVTLSKTTLQLELNEEETITATVLPTNATEKTITWVSNNIEVASVSNGTVVANSVGSSIITAYVDENGNASLDNDEKRATVSVTVTAKKTDPNPSTDPIPARGENLPIGNTSLSGPNNTTPNDITNWVNYDFSSSLPPYWSFIMGNNKRATSSDFYAPSAGGGFKFSQLYYGLQSPLLNSWLKTEVRLTVSGVFNNSQNANQHKNKPIFHIYSYDSEGYYIGMQTYDQQNTFANTKEIKFYIANPDMAYFEIRLNAFPCKGSQCYNFGVSEISLKGWPYGL